MVGAGGQRVVIQEYEYLRYDRPEDVFRPYDTRFPEVAERVAEIIRARMPDARPEHIGSTAVPGCGGKGIVDLLLVYPAGRLAAARDTLDSLGFQRQVGLDPFPEERPMRGGVIEHDGQSYRLHVHVVAHDAAEVETLVAFRDRLRANPALLEEYVQRKRDILTAGVSDNVAYNQQKHAFIQGVITPTD